MFKLRFATKEISRAMIKTSINLIAEFIGGPPDKTSVVAEDGHDTEKNDAVQ
ncbi:hypothetical protein [Fructilactobacillus florum]|uniref:hypothetical protein n=1 Tax=Fructilactobacillus florum TaxID=640331 RepID=UPI002092A7F0|nr:hypothetical protein [Fructilactobacillus florum]